MRITAVDTTIVRLPEVQVNGDGLQDILLIEIRTDEGLTGIGEAHTMPLALEAIIKAPVSQWAVTGLEQLLVGQDPLDIDAIWRLMRQRCGSVLGGSGLVMHAMSGIDIALHDLAAKARGVPVWQLLGGRLHDAIPVYASDLMPDTVEGLVARARALVDCGFRAIKFGWGALGADVDDDAAVFRLLRSEIGPDVDIMIDIGRPLTVQAAERIVRSLASEGIYFLEEPLAADDLDGYRSLSCIAAMPLAAGERATTVAEFDDYMRRGNLAIIQPDLARAGGFTGLRQIHARAAARGVRVIPHCWSSDILVAATAHFLTASSGDPLQEYNVMQQPLRTDLVTTGFTIEGGRIALDSTPGLGVAVDVDIVDRYRWPRPGRKRQASMDTCRVDQPLHR